MSDTDRELREKVNNVVWATSSHYSEPTELDECVVSILTLITQQCNQARIAELTQLDNTNLLNDSDAFHEHFMKRIAELQAQTKETEEER